VLEDILNFFKVKKPAEIKWAHAVNNKDKLSKAMENDSIMMIEGDISISLKTGELIMAHPPKIESDLTFKDWIQNIYKKNKGAKLDFKNPAAVSPALEFIQNNKYYDIPLFFNADILKGPGGESPEFNPIHFISECNEKAKFKYSYLSIGWTVGYSKKNKYSLEMIDEMLNLAEKSALPVTIPILVYLIPDSWTNLKKIVEYSDYTLTLWNIREINVGENLKNYVRKVINPDKTFIDLIDATGQSISIY
jgi:hypothetical protein